MAVHDLALAGLELDRAVVLAAGTVLRERLGHPDAATHAMRVAAHLARQERQRHRPPAVLDDLRVRGVAGHDEPVRPTGCRYAAVSQVHPEQIAAGPAVGWTPSSYEQMFA